MNIISTVVGLSIAGSAMPMMTQMAITPAIVQRQAINFGVAESKAVSFAAANEGQDKVASAPAGCELVNAGDRAYNITCTEGEKAYKATVTRSFRLSVVENSSYGGRAYGYTKPGSFGPHQCPSPDPWGVNYWNDMYASAVGACVPQDLWTRATYLASDPDAWLFDVNNHNAWGSHPDY